MNLQTFKHFDQLKLIIIFLYFLLSELLHLLLCFVPFGGF